MDSDRRFQHVLEACGVNKSLIKRGVKEGDTVIIGEVCYLFLKLISLKYPCSNAKKQCRQEYVFQILRTLMTVLDKHLHL